MVFYFYTTPDDSEEKYIIYMGKDKFENEDLIKFGYPEDLWFHVDDLSSAHVYLRIPPSVMGGLGTSVDLAKIPKKIIEECALLVKANSIEGHKLKRVKVVYTMWANLKKTKSMEVGQVGFHNEKEVYKVDVDKPKDNTVVNKINKTQIERDISFHKENWEKRQKTMQKKAKDEKKQKELEKESTIKKQKEEAEIRSYSSIMKEDDMRSNEDLSKLTVQQYEEDFM